MKVKFYLFFCGKNHVTVPLHVTDLQTYEMFFLYFWGVLKSLLHKPCWDQAPFPVEGNTGDTVGCWRSEWEAQQHCPHWGCSPLFPLGSKGRLCHLRQKWSLISLFQIIHPVSLTLEPTSLSVLWKDMPLCNYCKLCSPILQKCLKNPTVIIPSSWCGKCMTWRRLSTCHGCCCFFFF